MKLHTFRAATMHEALAIVRRELGPDAALLHTREVRPRVFGFWPGQRQIEVTASVDANVPSRLPQRAAPDLPTKQKTVTLRQEQAGIQSQDASGLQTDWSSELRRLYRNLLASDCHEAIAGELIQSLCNESGMASLVDEGLLEANLAAAIAKEIHPARPIEVSPGNCRVVAMVGPTGVGKTTTIAKLAANFRLKERRRVGLITLDTHRIAAAEQLRTYADIIDLPMEVVSTTGELRETIARMNHLDLILLDTAGRSAKDDVGILELKTFMQEATVHEVYLVLSSVTASHCLERIARRFAPVGVTSLVLTKLDESNGLGNLISLLRSCALPISYVTDGQNVPEDIQIADADRLSRMIVGGEEWADWGVGDVKLQAACT